MWERIEPGDVTLFARKGRFVASAITTLKLRNKALALELWGTHETGATWEYVYFLSGVRRHDIPYADFNRVVSYQPKAVPQRFLVLDEAKSEAAIDFFQLASDRYFPHVSEDQFRDAVVTFDPSRPLDAEGKTKRRTEQRFLRQQMFGNQTVGTCAICGRQLPVGLLTAAHIKRRSECSDEERLDFENIAAPMCQLGCDALYEDGYLSVVEGRVVAAKHESLTPALAGRLGELAGTECRSWGEGTRSYFAWHHRHTFTG